MMNTDSPAWLASRIVTVTILTGIAMSSWALPEDNQQPINIQSDRATQKSLANGEQTEYFGNVVMTQGSLLINGDHIIIHSKNRKATKIVAIGKPAKFQQQSTPNKEPVKAQANTINYELRNETLILAGNATIEQDGATVSGKRIEYNTATERVNANGGDTPVTMVFMPANNKSEEASKGNNDDNESAVLSANKDKLKESNANADSQ
ncbi:MAG: lipopolysaccharide transport periplasmic protein LptA [Pseudomonadales bacterium]